MKANKTKTVVGNIDPDVLQFTVGKDPILDLKLVKWDCLGSAAHVTMLTKMKYTPRLFSKQDRNNVVIELQEIMRRIDKNDFVITEADQDCHLAIERTARSILEEAAMTKSQQQFAFIFVMSFSAQWRKISLLLRL